MNMEELFGKAIYTYTRKQAIEDGVLVDVTPQAISVGFKYPVAMTRGAWEEAVEWSEEDTKRRSIHQDVLGRLHDVLWMLFMTIKRDGGGDYLPFQVRRVQREGNLRAATMCPLKALCGPGDDAEPVITILLPHED